MRREANNNRKLNQSNSQHFTFESLESRDLLAGDVVPPAGGVLGLRSDIDGNGVVDFADFVILSSTYEQSTPTTPNGDINADGAVDFHDFVILSENYLSASDLPTARVQILHNSPYASAAEVDVYLDGGLLGPLNDFAFRDATPFIDVPAGVEVQIDITAPDATDNASPVFSDTVTLEEGKSYVVAAQGDPGVSAGTTAFGLTVTDIAQESAMTAGNAEFLVLHGSPDAPPVDVVAREVGLLVDDIAYPEFDTGYLSVAPDEYIVDITPAADNDTTVASFLADLSGAAGAAIVVAASGFLTPPAETDPGFGLLAVFPNGDTALLPTAPEAPELARLQVIHNSPYAAAAVVDVYVNGELLPALDDFAFRSATPYIDVPAGVELQLDITAPNAADNSSPVFTTTVVLENNATYVAIADGDPTQSEGTTAFGIFVSATGQETAVVDGNVELLVFHGAPDAPTVDVIARGVATLVDDLSYPEFDQDYVSVPPGNYTIDITPGNDNDTVVASYSADLSAAANAALVVAASGFLEPMESDPEFGLLAVFANGDTALLPAAVDAALAIT